jgi:ammonium transporter, Amt family
MGVWRSNSLAALLLALATIFSGRLVMAETAPPPISGDIGEKVVAAKLAGDNAWMLTASALVLLMTAPGLAMFYGGLVRKKNVLGVMMQCVCLIGIGSVVWSLYGYSLAFGGSDDPKSEDFNPWIGNGEFLLMHNVQPSWDETSHTPVKHFYDDVEKDVHLPRLTHMLFEGMFFIITPALICGAFAERMKFSTMIVFTILWGTIVYCPLAHWVWGKGVLAFGSAGSRSFGGGALDFAGGTVVHISSGVSALICALVVGRRLGYGNEPMPPHNLTYTMVGAMLLWIGWFGFNAGSALGVGGLAASAFAATQSSAAAGAIAWPLMEWITRGKPSALGACSGAVAGLISITPAAGYVNPMPALVIGVAAGVVCFYACTAIKSRFHYDDTLDVFGVHGVGGTLGALLTGVFATRAVNDVSHGNPLGLLEGGSALKGQAIATTVTWVFAIVATFVILKILDATMGLRVSQQQEIQGLDISQHGEEGYIFI